MFGYIKPDHPELKVKEYELYRAVYCGLCDSMKKLSPFLPLSLSYDFVYLILLRAVLTNERFTFAEKRCFIHPLKKRKRVTLSPSVDFAARAALVLTAQKLNDDIKDGDTGAGKKIIYGMYLKIISSKLDKIKNSDPDTTNLYERSENSLEAFGKLEDDKCADIDMLSEAFSRSVFNIASYGLDGTEKLLCDEIVSAMGKTIYIIDALDDIYKDEKNGAFNPFLLKYGSADNAADHIKDIDMTVSLYIERLDTFSALLPSESDYSPILKNITSSGMSRVLGNVEEKIQKTHASKKQER